MRSGGLDRSATKFRQFTEVRPETSPPLGDQVGFIDYESGELSPPSGVQEGAPQPVSDRLRGRDEHREATTAHRLFHRVAVVLSSSRMPGER